MKAPTKKIKSGANLLASFMDSKNHASKALADEWRRSLFLDLLIANLRSEKKQMVSPPEEHPRLRSYRGQGPSVELRGGISCACGSCPPGAYHVTVLVDYIHESIDRMDEAEGCPGAPVQREFLNFSVPREVLEMTTVKNFEAWAKEERARRLQREREEAKKTISKLKQRYSI